MTKIVSLFQNETDLVKALQRGESKAQQRAYDKYASKMLAVCMRYVGDRTEAEDVMIEGLMKVFEKVHSFNFQGSFEGWVRRLMVNESLMYVRSRKTWQVDLDEAIEEPDYRTDFSSSLEVEALLKLIEELPIGYRTVFNMYAIEGFSHQEIANTLNISEGTSKSQLSRARAMLQERVRSLENSGNLGLKV